MSRNEQGRGAEGGHRTASSLGPRCSAPGWCGPSVQSAARTDSLATRPLSYIDDRARAMWTLSDGHDSRPAGRTELRGRASYSGLGQSNWGTKLSYLVVDGPAGKGVHFESGVGALDNLEGIRPGEDPEAALLVADAAITLGDGLDLGDFQLVDEGAAVAIATVGLEWGLLNLGHAVFIGVCFV